MSTVSTKHYFAISIGPVVETLLAARKTRELWTASYLLSTLMRELVSACHQHQNLKVLSPIAPATYPAPAAAPPLQVSVPLKPYEVFGAGVYPDRLYAVYEWTTKPSTEELNKIEQNIKDAAIIKVAKLARAGNNESRSSEHQVNEFYQQFFRIVSVWLGDAELMTEDGSSPNVLFNLNALLDAAELQPAYLDEDKLSRKNDQLTKLLNTPYSAKMVRDGLARDENNPTADAYHGLTNPQGWSFNHFPSTAHIASLGLYQNHQPEYVQLLEGLSAEAAFRPSGWQQAASENEVAEGQDTDVSASSETIREFYRLLEGGRPVTNSTAAYLNNLETLKPAFEDYHKYFCVVHADGDQFGKVIESLETDEAISKFSGQLGNYATAAARIVNDYGGKAIYIGGDDLVFLAPVLCRHQATNEEVTVFNLIAKLDKLFLSYAQEWEFTPSLSYGITLSHYKYPLFEAVPGTYDLLTQKAKKTKWPGKSPSAKKDAIYFRLVRHSGSYFEGHLDKELLNDFNALRELRSENDFLSSFTFKLRELEPLLDAIGDDLNDTRMAYLVGNFFNEPIHNRHRDNLTRLVRFYRNVVATKAVCDGKAQSGTDNAYALLRLMAFTLPEQKNAVNPNINHAHL